MENEKAQSIDARIDDEPSVNETELEINDTERQADVVKRRSIKLSQNAIWNKAENLQLDRKAKLYKLSKLKDTIVNLIGDKEYVKEVKCTFDRYQCLCDETKQTHEYWG